MSILWAVFYEALIGSSAVALNITKVRRTTGHNMADSLYTVFHKFCPQCATSVTRDAENCGCGYSFTAVATEDVASSLAQAIAEEKLYEDYLAARVAQTAQAAIAAQTVHQKSPQDSMYALAARNAVEEAEKSRAELAAQSAKVVEMEKALAAEQTQSHKAPVKSGTPLQVVAANAAPAAPAKAPVVSLSPVSLAPSQPAASAAPAPTAPAPVTTTHEPARILKKNISAQADEVTSAAEALRAELAQMRSGKREAARNDVQPTRKAEASIVTPTAMPQAQHAVPAASPVVVNSVNADVMRRAVIAKPVGEILEQANATKKIKREAAQAAKAQQIQQARLARQAERARQVQPQPMAQTVSAAVAARSTETSDVANNSDGAEAVQAKPRKTAVDPQSVTPATPVVKTKECANCTAMAALSVQRCKCGFEFPDIAHVTMPALVLDPTDAKNVVDLYRRR